MDWEKTGVGSRLRTLMFYLIIFCTIYFILKGNELPFSSFEMESHSVMQPGLEITV